MIGEKFIEKTVEELFRNVSFPKEPEGLYAPLRYMMDIGGKRIRPRLCLTSYSLYKDSFADGILELATALEVFHSFTLIHDDIMDRAAIRRGKTTVWKKWGMNPAILSGDVMSIDSFRRLASVKKEVLPDVLALFCSTASEVCEGQQLDMEFESEDNVAIEDYLKMTGLKTAVLIACSAKSGAIVAGASEKDCELLYGYGYNLGIAFQIADDYLDTFGDAAHFGKAIGGDILNGKKTWLLTRAGEKDRRAVAGVMSAPTGTEVLDKAKISAVTALYRDLGIDRDAREEIMKYTSLALEQAERLGLGRLRTEMLSRYAETLVGRTK